MIQPTDPGFNTGIKQFYCIFLYWNLIQQGVPSLSIKFKV